MKLVRGRCVKTALTFMALQTLVLECVYFYHLNTHMARYGTCTLPVMPKAYQPLTPFTFVRLFPALEEINVVASFSILHACHSYIPVRVWYSLGHAKTEAEPRSWYSLSC